MPIPSEEQIEELFEACDYYPKEATGSSSVSSAEFTGKKHKKLLFESTGYIEGSVCEEKKSVTILIKEGFCDFKREFRLEL